VTQRWLLLLLLLLRGDCVFIPVAFVFTDRRDATRRHVRLFRQQTQTAPRQAKSAVPCRRRSVVKRLHLRPCQSAISLRLHSKHGIEHLNSPVYGRKKIEYK